MAQVLPQVYGKWDLPETVENAFAKVAAGEWSLARFAAWVSQVELEEYRRATADESM
jgi:hypothetical protein